RLAPRPTLFPYTTLFRSSPGSGDGDPTSFAIAPLTSTHSRLLLSFPGRDKPDRASDEWWDYSGPWPPPSARRGPPTRTLPFFPGDRKSTRLNSSHLVISY